MHNSRSPTDRSWQALEIIRPETVTTNTYEQSPHRGLARTVYEGLWEYDCGPLSFLSLPGDSRRRTLLRAGSAPTKHHSRPTPVAESDIATPEMKTLAGLAAQQLPDAVGLRHVAVDTTPLGAVSAQTHRLLTTIRTTRGLLSTSPPALSAVLEAVADQPSALSVVARRGDNSLTELSVRLVEFDPTAQLETREEYAAARTDATTTQALVEPFEEAGYTARTNTELPVHHGWKHTTYQGDESASTDHPKVRKEHFVERDDSRATLAMALANAHSEYTTVFDRIPSDPLADGYQSLGYTSWITPGSESLPAFYPLAPAQYATSPWDSIPGRTTARIEPLTPIRMPATMSTPETDPTATATRRRASNLDGEYTPFEQAVCRWTLQRGATVEAIEGVENGFLQRFPDGTARRAFLIEPAATTDRSTTCEPWRGDLIAAARQARQHPTVDGLAVYCPSESVATAAFDTVVYPTRDTTPTTTTLYNESSVLRSTDNGAIAVRPTGYSPLKWQIVDGTTLQCRTDDTLVATNPYDEPLAGFVDQLPRVTFEAGTYTVSFPIDTPPEQFDDKHELVAAFRPICRPARPGTVGSLLDSTTVFYSDGSDRNFTSKRVLASWDRPLITGLHRAAVDQFLEQYTIEKQNASLPLEQATAELYTYLRYQTDEQIDWLLSQYLSFNTKLERMYGRAWRYTPH